MLSRPGSDASVVMTALSMSVRYDNSESSCSGVILKRVHNTFFCAVKVLLFACLSAMLPATEHIHRESEFMGKGWYIFMRICARYAR